MKNSLLKSLREKNGYSQSQIAEFLGVDQSLIARIENGERNISIEDLKKIAYLYGAEYNDIINDHDVSPIKVAYRTNEFNKDDLQSIVDINKIALNLRFMERIINENE